MLTVPEAARRSHRNPETIRRWIRAGRLPAQKIGSQHLVDERDLAVLTEASTVALPEAWRRSPTGAALPDIVAALRESRAGR